MFAARKVKSGSVKHTYAIMLTYIDPVSLLKLILPNILLLTIGSQTLMVFSLYSKTLTVMTNLKSWEFFFLVGFNYLLFPWLSFS